MGNHRRRVPRRCRDRRDTAVAGSDSLGLDILDDDGDADATAAHGSPTLVASEVYNQTLQNAEQALLARGFELSTGTNRCAALQWQAIASERSGARVNTKT